MATRARRRSGRLSPTQARAERRRRRQRRRRFLRYGALLGIGGIAFVFIVALFAGSLAPFIGTGGPSGDAGESVRIPAGYDPGGTPHLNALDEDHREYSSIPPTSGWHIGQTARWGVHDEPLPNEVLMHNLEHAGVIIHYSCADGCPELVLELKEIVDQAQKVILSPYPDMDTKIALTAWGYIDRLDAFDRARIADFINAHVNSSNAPEPFAQ